jgi:hypothetical protein
MDDLDRMIVFGVVLPFVIGWVFVLPMSKRRGRVGGATGADGATEASTNESNRSRTAGRDRHAWRIVLAVGVASIVAFLGLFDWPTDDLSLSAWWGGLGQDQLVAYAVLVGMVLGIVMSVTPRAMWLRAVLVVVLAALVTLIAWPIVRTESLLYKAMPAAGTVVFAALFEVLAVRRAGVCVPIALSLSLGTTAVLVAATGFQPLGLSAVAAAVVLGVCSIVALWRPVTVADGVVLVVVPLLVLVPLFAWVNLMFYGDAFPAMGFLLPMFAPCMVFLGDVPKLRGARPIVRNGVVLTLVALMCGAGVGLAFLPTGDTSEGAFDEMGFPIDP